MRECDRRFKLRTGCFESLIKSKDVPAYPFKIQLDEVSNISDEGYAEMVKERHNQLLAAMCIPDRA